MLLVLLHGVNRNPQDLDIFTKSVLLQQVGIALQCNAVYQICKQYFLVHCNLGQSSYAFHGVLHVSIGITLCFYCVYARFTWRSVLIVCS